MVASRMKWRQKIVDRKIVKQGYLCQDCGEYRAVPECNCKPVKGKKAKKATPTIDVNIEKALEVDSTDRVEV